MANSFIRYPQQEGVKVFGIPFGYLSKDHIHVYVNGVEATEGFTLDVETSRVTFDTAPNSVVKIQRETPRDERPVDFQDGSLLEERDLDLDSIYHQFIAQEAFDALANSIQRTDTGEWDAQGRRVANVGDPQDPADAATQEWVKGHFSWDIIQGYVGEAEAHKNGALEAEQRTQGIREATQQDTANVIADAQAEADRSKVEADRAAEKADFALAQGDRATNEADRSEAQANRGAEILKVIEQGGSVGSELMTDPAILTPDDWAFSSAKVEVAEGKLWFREAETEADTATVTTIPVENGQFYFIRINNVSITGGELELIQHDTRTYRLKAGNNMFIFRAKGPKPFVIRNPDPSDPVTAFIDYMSVRPIEQDFMQGVNACLDRATDAHAVDPTNDWHLMTPATTRTAVDAVLGVLPPPPSIPTGSILPFGGETAPQGWLKCNGATISRTAYAALFEAIGTAFGDGDGSTTFNIPDTRGVVLRGVDDGRGLDGGRVLGTFQEDGNKEHRHSINLFRTDGYAGRPGTGNYISVGSEYARISYINNERGFSLGGGYVTGSGAPEARMKNLAVHHIIKY